MKKLLLIVTIMMFFGVDQMVQAKDVSFSEGSIVVPLTGYVQIHNSCDYLFEGGCLNVRSRPTTNSVILRQFRTGSVHEIDYIVWNDNRLWYHITVDSEKLFFPDRKKGEWYIAVQYTRWIGNISENSKFNYNKSIIVDLDQQTITAYEDGEVFLETFVSTGNDENETPKGTFTILRKTPSRYMQGPLPYIETKDIYDLPGVSWVMYFNSLGDSFHGTYWHNDFGRTHSHGCVNLPTDVAEILYNWTAVGTKVVIRD